MKRSVVVLVAALVGMGAGAVVVDCSNDSSSGDGGGKDATSDGDGAPPDYGSVPGHLPDGAPLPGGECLTDNDCTGPGNQRCLYPVGAACGSLGTCTTLPEDGAGCAEAGLLDPSETTSCSCDGTPLIQVCPLPAGYTRGDIVHAGPCADGGQVCDPELRNCPDGQICGFRVSDGCAVTTAHCYDGPDPTIAIPGVLLEGCACDGGTALTFPDTDDFVTAPVPGRLASCSVDAGPDADADDAGDAGDVD